jgi:hypothetical protein
MLKRGDRGPAVLTLQRQLLALGRPLPRFGADGALGDETLQALDDLLFAHRDGVAIKPDGEVTDAELALVAKLHRDLVLSPPLPLPATYVDWTDHPIPDSRHWRYRGWATTRGVVLHQTACIFGETNPRWKQVPVHIGVTRGGRVLHLNRLDWQVPAANGLNGTTISIEIEGRFPGVEGDNSTLWNYPKNQPTELTDAQVAATLEAIRWAASVIQRNGGQIRFLWAHRQSCDAEAGKSRYGRRSDPGGEVWRRVALVVKKELQLEYGAGGGVVGSGLPIPGEWDPSRQGYSY